MTVSSWRLGFAGGVFFFVSLISAVAYVGSLWVSFNMAELEAPRTLGAPLLGADDDRLWLFLREPVVLSQETGEILARGPAIEERNPPLEGVLPRDMSHYRFFDGYGLVFTAADARPWLLDVQTLAAVPWQGDGPIRRETAIAPQYFAPSHTKSFQKRGLTLPRNWLGVLTEDEAKALTSEVAGQARGASAAFAEYMRAPPDLSHAGPKRFRLWHAKVEQVSAAPPGWSKNLPDNWGKRPRYSDFVVFEKSPEFLQAGLLSDGRSPLPLLPTAPDSVLVLHRDRIDEDGRLHVTRFAGPDGRVLWDAPYHSAHEWVISLDMKDGAVRTFNLSAVDEER